MGDLVIGHSIGVRLEALTSGLQHGVVRPEGVTGYLGLLGHSHGCLQRGPDHVAVEGHPTKANRSTTRSSMALNPPGPHPVDLKMVRMAIATVRVIYDQKARLLFS